MTEECRCDWCLGWSGSDDLSLAKKAVEIQEEQRRFENDPRNKERQREIAQLLRKEGIIK